MKKHKNLWLYVVLVVLGINAIYSHMKIADLESYIENTRNYAENESISLRNNINNIYQNVDAKLEKEASFLSHFEVEEGNIDTTKHTVMIDLDVVPKELNNHTKLTLQYKDNTYAFKREGDVFSVSFAADLFSSYEDKEYCFVKIENNNQTKIQKLEDMDLFNMYQRYLPYFSVANFSEKVKSTGNIVFNLDTSIHIPGFNEQYKNGYKEFYLVTVINGKMHKQHITTAIKGEPAYNDGVAHFTKKLELDATDNDDVKVYLEAVDELGYTHQRLVFSTDDDFSFKKNEDELILDKDGNALTKR